MNERRRRRIERDTGLRTRWTDHDTPHDVLGSTSTFHLRWSEHLKPKKRVNRKAA